MDASVLEGIIVFIKGLSSQYPILVGIFAILYTIGIALKIFLTATKEFVVSSPSKKDDEVLAKVEGHKIYKIVLFVLDLLIRFKIK